MKWMVRQKRTPPTPASKSILTFPLWSLTGLSSNSHYTQEDVLAVMQTLKNQSFDCTQMTLDGHWQKFHGDFEFDQERFPDIKNLSTEAKNLLCGFRLEV